MGNLSSQYLKCFQRYLLVWLLIQVDISIDDNFNRIAEYFIELNDIDEEYNYEPCGKYNEHSEYKNFDLLIETIDNYLKYHGIEV